MLGLMCASGQAAPNDTEDLMNIAWEGMWHQGGSPSTVRKWTEPLRVRIQGERGAGDSEVIQRSLDKISSATHLSYTLLTGEGTGENLLIDIVKDSPLVNDSTTCVTHHKFKARGLSHATVTARNGKVWQCMLHELAHVVGVVGHPSKGSVLTYFGGRNDELTPIDKFILSVRYSDAMPDGTLPLHALRILGRRHVQSLDDDLLQRQAQEAVDKFLAKTLVQMEDYARGGEPPTHSVQVRSLDNTSR